MLFPVLGYLAVLAMGSGVVKVATISTVAASAAASKRKLKKAQELDLNEPFENEVAKKMGRDEAEFSPYMLRADVLPKSLRRYAGLYLLTPRDIVVLTYAVRAEQSKDPETGLGRFVRDCAKKTGLSEVRARALLYAETDRIRLSLPALLEQMKKSSAARMGFRQKRAA